MEKDFILDRHKTIVAEIEYQLHREFFFQNERYTHYVGKIISAHTFEIPLEALLKEKREMINQGIFATDEINEKINEYQLSLQKRNQTILNLYLQENNIDFLLFHHLH